MSNTNINLPADLEEGDTVTLIVPPGTPEPPPPPPPTNKPWGPYGGVFKKDFSDGKLAPFSVATWPDDHIGGSGQYMTVFCRYRGHAAPTIHDGYLDLRAVRQPSGNLWNADFVQSSQDGHGLTFGFGVYRFWVRYNVGPGTWQTCWLYDTTNWSADEIDWPETLENLHLVAHVLGKGAGSAGGNHPADIATVMHEFKIERRANFTAFSIDGVETGRVTSPQSSRPLAILLDSKVGFGWMGGTGQITAQTPNPTFLHVFAVTVDP